MSTPPRGYFSASSAAVGIDSGTAEGKRLQEDRDGQKDWREWGPYLSERQWSTVREDYSANGTWYATKMFLKIYVYDSIQLYIAHPNLNFVCSARHIVIAS